MTVKFKKVKDYYGDNDFETTRLGFVHDDFFITELFSQMRIDVKVDPMKEYGLTQQQTHEIDKFNYYSDPDYYRFQRDEE